MTFRSREELREFLRTWSSDLAPGDLIFLTGEMGAGKTTLTGLLVDVLGGAAAASPTYALHHEYHAGDWTIDHWDLYRVKSEDEIEGAGFWDLLADARRLTIVEWPQILGDVRMPGRRVWSLDLSVSVEGHRELAVRSDPS